MNMLFLLAVVLFLAISACFLFLSANSNKSRYITKNIKGASRGHLNMICPPSTVDRKRSTLNRSHSKF